MSRATLRSVSDPSLHSTRKRASTQEDAATCAVLFVLTAVLLWPQLGQGRVLFWGDIGLYFLPMTSFLHGELARGHVPLWNPFLLCGTPFVGNPQASPFYPLTFLLAGTNAAQFLNLSIAFHTGLAACGTFLLLRRAQGRTVWAALLGAVTFAFGGQFLSKEQFPNMLAAMAYVPFALLCVQRLAQNLSIGNALLLGMVLGLQLLAAHAQVSLMTLYLCAAWWIGHSPTPARRRLATPPSFARKASQGGGKRQNASPPGARRQAFYPPSSEEGVAEFYEAGGGQRRLFRQPILGFLLAGCVAAGLSAVQVLPTVAMLRDAWRQGLTFAVVDRFFLPPNQLLSWVLPTLHGHPSTANFTGRGNFWETCCYVGFMLFALAMWGAWQGRQARFWAVTFVVGAWLATGGAGGLYHLAYWILPGVRSFHDPARCLLIAAFALSVLAAAGADAVLHTVNGRGRVAVGAVLLALVFIDLAHFDRDLYPTLPPSALAVRGPILSAVLSDPDVESGQARTLSPDTARVWQRWTGHRSYRAHEPNYFPLWTETLTPNFPMQNGVRDAFGYEPVARRDAQTVTVRAVNALRAEHAGAASEAGLLSVKYAVLLRATPPRVPGWRVVQSEHTLPPLGQAHDPARVYLLLNEHWQPRARVQNGTARIVSDAPDAVTVETDCTSQSVLTLADTLAPGWNAQLDGKSVPIARTEGLLRTVPLPLAGRHTVTFSYRPTPFLLGLYVSLLTVLCLTGWGTSKLVQKIIVCGKENPSPVSNLAN